MREGPTLRIPLGILGLLAVLAVYALVIARYVPELIGGWPALVQTVVYVALGQPGFAALTCLIASCPAAALDYPDTDSAVRLVETLWEAAV